MTTQEALLDASQDLVKAYARYEIAYIKSRRVEQEFAQATHLKVLEIMDKITNITRRRRGRRS